MCHLRATISLPLVNCVESTYQINRFLAASKCWTSFLIDTSITRWFIGGRRCKTSPSSNIGYSFHWISSLFHLMSLKNMISALSRPTQPYLSLARFGYPMNILSSGLCKKMFYQNLLEPLNHGPEQTYLRALLSGQSCSCWPVVVYQSLSPLAWFTITGN